MTGLTARLPSMPSLPSFPTLQGPDIRTGLPLALESEPSGAEVRLSTGEACRTPCSLPVPLVPGLVATFSFPGYRSVSVPVQIVGADPGVEAEFALANTRLDPNPVFVELQPAATAAPAAPPKRRPTAARAQAGQSKPAATTRTPRQVAPREVAPQPSTLEPPASTPPPVITPATPLPPS